MDEKNIKNKEFFSSYSTIHICRIYDESGEFDVKS